MGIDMRTGLITNLIDTGIIDIMTADPEPWMRMTWKNAAET